MMNINTIHVALIGAAVTAVAGLVFVANAQTRVQSLPPALAPAGCLPGMIPTPGWSERTPPIHADRWRPIRNPGWAISNVHVQANTFVYELLAVEHQIEVARVLTAAWSRQAAWQPSASCSSQPASQPASKARPGEGGRLLNALSARTEAGSVEPSPVAACMRR